MLSASSNKKSRSVSSLLPCDGSLFVVLGTDDDDLDELRCPDAATPTLRSAMQGSTSLDSKDDSLLIIWGVDDDDVDDLEELIAFSTATPLWGLVVNGSTSWGPSRLCSSI